MATTDVSMDPANALLRQARIARGVVEIYRDDFATVIDTTVKNDLYIGSATWQSDAGVYKLLAYQGECSKENLARYGVRHDLYVRAQNALRALMQPSVSPKAWTWSQYTPKAIEREEIATVTADWLTVVYNWVSLAHFAANVQPDFLYPASTTTVGTTGEYKPAQRNWPLKVQSATNNIAAFGSLGAERGRSLVQAGHYGPSWMGFYDEAPTGWLTCKFNPQADGSTRKLLDFPYRRGGLKNANPKDWATYTPRYVTDKAENRGVTMFQKIVDPWFLWFYNVVASKDCSEYVTEWRFNPNQARDANYSRFVVGPRGSFELAQAWGDHIVASTVFDIARPSFAWYQANHMVYWQAKGYIDYTSSEINALQRQTASAMVEAKGAAAAQAINSVAGAAMAVPNPIVQGVAAGIALVGSLITMGVVARRKKKKAAQAQKPQPLTIRTMTNVECATFGARLKLPAGLEEAAKLLLDGDLRSMQGGVISTASTSTVTSTDVSTTPLGTTSSNPVNNAPGAGEAPPPPTPETALTAANNPAVLEEQANHPATPPAESAEVSTQKIPTLVWVGIGVIGAALVVRTVRKG